MASKSVKFLRRVDYIRDILGDPPKKEPNWQDMSEETKELWLRENDVWLDQCPMASALVLRPIGRAFEFDRTLPDGSTVHRYAMNVMDDQQKFHVLEAGISIFGMFGRWAAATQMHPGSKYASKWTIGPGFLRGVCVHGGPDPLDDPTIEIIKKAVDDGHIAKLDEYADATTRGTRLSPELLGKDVDWKSIE